MGHQLTNIVVAMVLKSLRRRRQCSCF